LAEKTSQTSQPEKTTIEQETENPANLDPNGDFEKMFGEEIRSSDKADVGGEVRGFAIEYADGTIVFNPEDGEQMIFKARKGDDEAGYDVYDRHGARVENVIWGMDPDELFP
jgi:hypothetical protein